MIPQRNKFQKDERRQTFLLFISLFVRMRVKEKKKKTTDVCKNILPILSRLGKSGA
jgi:hypothetical protein